MLKVEYHPQTDNNNYPFISLSLSNIDNVMVRRSRRKIFDTSIPSPCVGLCRLYDHAPYCQGCYRHQDEIRSWPIFSAQQKQTVLDELPKRIKTLDKSI